jgi:hypothetical protein
MEMEALLDQATQLRREIEQHGCVTGTCVQKPYRAVQRLMADLTSRLNEAATAVPAEGDSLQALHLELEALYAALAASRNAGTALTLPTLTDMQDKARQLAAQMVEQQVVLICSMGVNAAMCSDYSQLLTKAGELQECLAVCKKALILQAAALKKQEREVQELSQKLMQKSEQLTAAEAGREHQERRADTLQATLHTAGQQLLDAEERVKQQKEAFDQAAAAFAAAQAQGPIALQLVIQQAAAPAAAQGEQQKQQQVAGRAAGTIIEAVGSIEVRCSAAGVFFGLSCMS